MSGFQEIRYYSPVLGCEAARLSMFDHNGSEFFIMLPVKTGKAWREDKMKAVEKIADAMEQDGAVPGEVAFP